MEHLEKHSSECQEQYNIRIAVFVATMITLVFDCFKLFRTKRRIQDLETENRSLKTRILRNIDDAFVSIIKNGNRTEEDHED